MLGDLEAEIAAFVENYNHRRYPSIRPPHVANSLTTDRPGQYILAGNLRPEECRCVTAHCEGSSGR